MELGLGGAIGGFGQGLSKVADMNNQAALEQFRIAAHEEMQARAEERRQSAADAQETAVSGKATGLLAQRDLDKYNMALRQSHEDNPQMSMDEYRGTTDYANRSDPTPLEIAKARVDAATGTQRKEELAIYNGMLRDANAEAAQATKDRLAEIAQQNADANTTRAEAVAEHTVGIGKSGQLPSDAAMIEYYAVKVLDDNTPAGRRKAAEWVKQSKGKSAEELRTEFITRAASNGITTPEEAISAADKLFPSGKAGDQPKIRTYNPKTKTFE